MKTNWPTKKLGEVTDFLDNLRKPITESQRIIGPYPYYGANGQVGWINNYIFNEDLILLAEDGGNFGSKTKPIAYKISGKTWVNNHAHVLRPKDGMDINWLLFNLMFADVARFIKGATRAKLNQGDARKIEIPVPPIEEQKRIVKKLEKILAKIEEACSCRRQSNEETKNIINSAISNIFFSNKKKKSLGELVKLSSGELLNKDKLNNGPYSVYGGGGYVGQYDKYLINESSIGIGRVGARCGCVFQTNPQSWITDNALYIKELSKETNLDYLYWVLQSLNLRKFANEAAQPVISQNKIYSQEIYFPDLKEQEKIVAYLDGLSEKVQVLQKLQKEQLQDLEALKQSVLHQAFQGEL